MSNASGALKRLKPLNRRQKYFELLFVIILGCIFFYLSAIKELNYGPDEAARILLPNFIYKKGMLPTGFDNTFIKTFGISYAFFPNFLGPIASSLFMNITSLFDNSAQALLVAARFTSVLSGVFTAWFLFKIGDILFTSPTKWLITVLFSTTPQFVFMSTYVNNDIIAVCGSAVICYSWVSGLIDGWNFKNSLLLALGISIVVLSYYNAYGWVLVSAFVFILSYVFNNKTDKKYKNMVKLFIFIFAVVAVLCLYFFIRNYNVHHGDFLGLKTMGESSEKYALPNLKPSARYTPDNRGLTFSEMLDDKTYNGLTWWDMTLKSFVGVFRLLDVFMPDWIYTLYYVIYTVCAVCFIGQIIQWIIFKNNLHFINGRTTLLFYAALIIQIIIPIALSLYYSYYMDYQAQGRYIYPMYIALAVILGTGAEWLFSLLRKLSPKIPKITAGIVSAFMIFVSASVFITIYIPT